ncbi:hypothetical protein CHS0354_001636 [Potamilus streckersoni]|nr:hypothetical protein CHS0354_001636 [Potamilus streckersoni]
MPNESILSVMWLKDEICIAKVTNDTFTPCESYNGRVEVFDTFGMSLHNISRNDSGHYNVVILLKNSHHTFLPCHPTYFPVLPEQRSEFREGKALQFAVGDNSSTCDQQGASKLEIGLICGVLPLTVITGISVIVWYFRRRKHAQNSKNDLESREQIKMI